MDPNVTKALAIVTLGQATFGLAGLYFDNYVAEANSTRVALYSLRTDHAQKTQFY
jgi:hypothetical protein